MSIELREFINNFQSKEYENIEIFRNSFKIFCSSNIEEKQVEEIINLLADWTGNLIYREGRQLLENEIKFLSQSFDYDMNIGIGIEIKAKKVFPPTIGRYIANLVHQYKMLQRRIKFVEEERNIEHDKIFNYQQKIVSLYEESSEDIKSRIEGMFPEFFGAEEDSE